LSSKIRLPNAAWSALRYSGHVVMAGDGTKDRLAESNIRRHHLDVMLPKRDGLDVLRALRRTGRGKVSVDGPVADCMDFRPER
jgi:DNA-binding response OmpR family regulator